VGLLLPSGFYSLRQHSRDLVVVVRKNNLIDEKPNLDNPSESRFGAASMGSQVDGGAWHQSLRKAIHINND
jgi:hypothetical protein